MRNKLRIFYYLLLFCSCQAVAAVSLGDRLSNAINNIGTSHDEILDPEIAFAFTSDVNDQEELSLNWRIEEGYYLYQNRFFVESQTEELEIGSYDLPKGKQKDDPEFGLVTVNVGDTEFTVPLIRKITAEFTGQILVKYQGCKEDSVCYPPQEKLVDVSFQSIKELPNTVQSDNADLQSKAKVSEQDIILSNLANGSFTANIALFFGFGLLLSLTPCVFPMIPILSGIIVGQSNEITTKRAFVLSLTYVIAMALTYALLGLLAGSFQFNLQAASQNIWVIIGFSLVFVLLALSMFGFYELQLPSAIQNRLNQLSDNQQTGSLQGTAIMGVLSAIIVGPCVAPPLAGALLYISQTGDAILGGLALFAMGLGFGVPLLIIGTSAGNLLPKAGGWMEAIKAIFGVIMLGVAIWFLQRVLPGQITLMLWAALLIVSAIFMGALDQIDAEKSWARLWKGLGIVLLLYGLMLVVASTLGGSNPLHPFQSASFTSNNTRAISKLDFKPIKSIEDLQQELATANAQNKFVMLDFYADWCIVCKELEAYTFSDSAVQASLNNVILLKADVTANDDVDKALLSKFNLFGPPAVLFFEPSEKERIGYRLVGFIKANDFIAHVKQATAL